MNEMNFTVPATYRAALYLRLSKDDEGTAESASIANQRKMLRAYTEEHHYTVYGEYVDDGWSGTNFDRPAFQRMLKDIEAGRVNLVITKDLSRLGRDYILAGQYTEIYFPSKGVRYIAVNDHYDSENGAYNDIVPFKNVINEMYARDASQKIRSAFAARMREGAFVGAFAPYGYRRDPADKHHLLVDDGAAEVVRKIFYDAAAGTPPSQIARSLNRMRIPPPSVYRSLQNSSLHPEDVKGRGWTSSTISKMLRNPVYLGQMAQGKTTKLSFKSSLTISNPQENWYIVPDTHEPLVSRELFETASRRSRQRTCEKKGSFHNIFSGTAKCADCGRNMSAVGTRKKSAAANLTCGGYKLYGKSECSNHFIEYGLLARIVLSSIREAVRLSPEEEEAVLNEAEKRLQKRDDTAAQHRELAKLKRRSQELDRLIEALYNDYAAGFLKAERAEKLLSRYEKEAEEIDRKISALKKSRPEENKPARIDLLKRALKQYLEPPELTPSLLYRLIDRIEIGQGEYQKTEHGRVKRQHVTLYFRFDGTPSSKIYSE